MPGAPSRSSDAVKRRPISGCTRSVGKRSNGHGGPLDALRFAGADEVAGRGVIEADALEDRAALLPVAVVRGRELQLRVTGRASRTASPGDPASGNGSGRSSTKSVTENAAVVAPMPSATITTAVSANPGARRSMRAAVAEILPQEIPVHQRGVADHFGDRRRSRAPTRAERSRRSRRRRANTARISSPYSLRNDAG